MPRINNFSEYNEFMTPGLYQIINRSSGTFLDLSGSETIAGPTVTGHKWTGNDNQKWQIADVGDSKYIIICRLNGTYIRAIKDGKAVESRVGHPDLGEVHWKIVKPDAGNPQLTEFHSVTIQGDVLELEEGSDSNGTEVRANGQNPGQNGQQWLLKKITN